MTAALSSSLPVVEPHHAFVSYRRKDATSLARWLSGRLRRYRLPRSLDPEQHSAINLFLDTEYERPSDDFWVRKIVPHLHASRYLVVVVTPGALEMRGDESNWVEREVREYLDGVGSVERVIVVLGPGASVERLPGKLESLSQRWDAIDLRSFSSLYVAWPFAWERLDDELVKLAARLLDVDDRNLPDLRNAEGRRRARILRWTSLVAVLIAAALATVAIWALIQRRRAQEAQHEAENAQRLAEERTLREQGARAELLAQQPGREGDALVLGIQTVAASARRANLAMTAAVEGIAAAVAGSLHPILDLAESQEPLRAISFSPFEPHVLTASQDGAARIWDVRDGKLVRKIGLESWVCSATYSHEGKSWLTASEDGVVQIFTQSSGTSPANRFETRTRGCFAAIFSPDDRSILAGGTDGAARLWTMTGDGSPRLLKHDHAREVSATFSPNGRLVATAGDDGTIRLWSSSSGARIVELSGHGPGPLNVAFSPDSKWLVSASEDETARIWSVGSRGTSTAVIRHGASVRSAEFSPNGAMVVTASDDATAAIYSMAAGHEIALLRLHEGPVVAAHFDRQSNRVLTASADGTARLWSHEGRQLAILDGHRNWVTLADFSPDRKTIATAGRDGRLLVWRADVGQPVAELEADGRAILSAEYSADGTRIAAATTGGSIGEWSAPTGERLRLRDTGIRNVAAVAFAHRSRQVLLTSRNGSAMVWDLAADGPGPTFTRQKAALMTAEYSPDDRLAVTATDERVVLVWDSATGAVLRTLDHEAPVRSAHFSGDGRQVLTMAQDGRARAWNAATSALLATTDAQAPPVFDAIFSPDGRTILSCATGSARVSDADRGTTLHDFVDERASVYACAYSRDGTRIVTAGADRKARLWDGKTFAPVAVLVGHLQPVTRAAFSDDGQWLATGSEDGVARVWYSANGDAAGVFAGHSDAISHLVLSGDHRRLLTGGADGKARIYATTADALLRLACDTLRLRVEDFAKVRADCSL
jgi:WD40 repeat protein